MLFQNTPFRKWQRRIRYWLNRKQRSEQLREEMEFHLSLKAGQFAEQGLPSDEARRQAALRFGNVTRQIEDSRETWIFRWMTDLVQDFSFALRSFRRQPGFALVAIVSSALGIGACSTIFGIANYAMFRSLPVDEPSRLMSITRSSLTSGEAGDTMSYPSFLDLRQAASSFQSIGGFFPVVPATINSNGEPRRYWGALVTANYFDVVRTNFALGRGFTSPRDDKPGETKVVVLSHHVWRTRFNADTGIVGKTIYMDNQPMTVLGVTRPEFRGTEVALVSDFWWPMSMAAMATLVTRHGEEMMDRNNDWIFALGRLRDGVSVRTAQAEADVIAKRLAAQHPETNRTKGLHVETAGQLNAGLRRLVEVFFLLLLLVTLLVLLTACANVANLLLARASARHKEIATRLAIGAGRGRLLRQLLTESLILALAGGAAGYVFALWAADSIGKFPVPFPVPLDLAFTLDNHVVLFSIGLSLFTGTVFGLAPALRATKADLTLALKGSASASAGLRRFGARDVLVVVQVAVCMLLLVCSGLFLRSLGLSRVADTGMKNRNVLLLAFDPTLHRHTPTQSRQFLKQILQKTESLTAVESATLTTNMPLSLAALGTHVIADDKIKDPDKSRVDADLYAVAPRFFETLGIPLLSGEDFRANSGESDDVAIINDTLAHKLFDTQNPIGRRLRYEQRMLRIIGVVATARSRSINERPIASIYLPLLRSATENVFGLTLLVKTKSDPARQGDAVRAAVRDVDSAMPIFDVRTMETHLKNALLLPRLGAILFGLCGVMGLLIATVGLYGVMSFAVSRRTREIGIRVALGARRTQVLGMILRYGLTLAAAGCVIGLAASVAVSRAAASLLYGISSTDVPTFLLTPLFLLGVTVTACLIPARRAASLDPVTTLRYE